MRSERAILKSDDAGIAVHVLHTVVRRRVHCLSIRSVTCTVQSTLMFELRKG